jgi:hypothetical protein
MSYLSAIECCGNLDSPPRTHSYRAVDRDGTRVIEPRPIPLPEPVA